MDVQLAFLLVTRLAGLQTPVPEAKKAEPATVARTVAKLGNEYVIFELQSKDGSAQCELRMRRASERGDMAPRVLWTGRLSNLHPSNERLSFAMLPDGSWGIASGWQPDSVSSFHVWRGTQANLKWEGPADTPAVAHMGFLMAEIDGAVCPFLDSAMVFAWKDRLRLVGSTQDTMARSSIWMAELPEQQTHLGRFPARRVAEGVDPRIVVNDGEALLAARAPFARANDIGPVRFYRSRDLATWTPDLELWQYARARDNYSVAVDENSVSVVTTGEEPKRLERWLYRLDDRRWSMEPPRSADRKPPLGSAREGLWYFASGSGSGVLFGVTESGTFEYIDLLSELAQPR